MPTYFDTHAHYFDKKFSTLEGGANGILNSDDFRTTVSGVINAGTNLENSRTAVEMAVRYPFMYAAVGIHPEDAQGLPDGAPMNPDAVLTELEDWVKDSDRRRREKIVAIGEIGLDYYWEPMDKPLQKAFFEGQLEIARRTGLPVLIHDREAHGDCFETILKYPSVKGVFHSYSGSAEMALELIKRGWYISFSGVATFKNANRVREVIARIPIERLLIETDAPYLAPHPLRGTLNHSGNLEYTNRALAEIKGVSEEEMAKITEENARRVFGL